ncbi:unnamed protein product [Protopolystoma xenopodis]|uniref:Uncharacterized protein n=1 Tax=Protopolystoma xenopodis TaxID=117903 RepID=A0A3S4ZVV4_9PLAT|nr:unnamed protein product [Protopolystoma xenopodis]
MPRQTRVEFSLDGSQDNPSLLTSRKTRLEDCPAESPIETAGESSAVGSVLCEGDVRNRVKSRNRVVRTHT